MPDDGIMEGGRAAVVTDSPAAPAVARGVAARARRPGPGVVGGAAAPAKKAKKESKKERTERLRQTAATARAAAKRSRSISPPATSVASTSPVGASPTAPSPSPAAVTPAASSRPISAPPDLPVPAPTPTMLLRVSGKRRGVTTFNPTPVPGQGNQHKSLGAGNMIVVAGSAAGLGRHNYDTVEGVGQKSAAVKSVEEELSKRKALRAMRYRVDRPVPAPVKIPKRDASVLLRAVVKSLEGELVVDARIRVLLAYGPETSTQ